MEDHSIPLQLESTSSTTYFSPSESIKPSKNKSKQFKPNNIWLASTLFHMALLITAASFAPFVAKQISLAEQESAKGIVQFVKRPPQTFSPRLPGYSKPLAVSPVSFPRVLVQDSTPAPEITEVLPDISASDALLLSEGVLSLSALFEDQEISSLPIENPNPNPNAQVTDPINEQAVPSEKLPADTAGLSPEPRREPKAKRYRAPKPKGRLRVTYPRRMLSSRTSATVVLDVTVDPEGRAKDIEVVSDQIHRSFIKAALKAARSARYQPAEENGEAVEGKFRLKINFELED